ncbi:class I SAM-dependent methyltransferase [Actinokineospora iranica]|uniref:Methyltransferase domain-containing protein n=1 Tax=Actinokineospora iranica TaxID=1271860 RepID=A0A1G6M4Z1_9PSEU|nr:class I SAM-dependent methyltransferase [Actinokineospora iranica]SDC50563.1 Methyltransferase domain-containing protein [Actinokineospora iranica]
MTTPAEAWERFAQKASPRRATNAVGAATWLNWTQYPDHGPDESVLGPVDGRKVVELGSGTGANLAHLATLGARCVGVDIAPTRTTTARHIWGALGGIEFVTADAVDHLAANPATYDVVYSVFGAVWFTDPEILLPLVREALTPGGVLVFSHLPASDTPPSADRLIRQYHLPVEQWESRLRANGFGSVTIEIVAPPTPGELGTLLARASRS